MNTIYCWGCDTEYAQATWDAMQAQMRVPHLLVVGYELRGDSIYADVHKVCANCVAEGHYSYCEEGEIA